MNEKPLPAKTINNAVNPFLSRSLFNLPLRLELAQEIHFAALRRAVFQPDTAPAPVSIVSDQFRQQVSRWSTELCLAHPAHIARVFAGVTTAVYQAIERLYCDPLSRSPKLVYHLLSRMAGQAGQTPLHAEAVWAICTYLYQKRQEKTEVLIRRTGQIWQLLTLTPDLWLRDEPGARFQPAIGCVLNFTSRQVLGFQVAPRDSDPEIIRRLALYQALTAERTPGVLVPGGLVWHLPRAVVPDTELAPATRRQLEHLDIFALRPRQLINETTSALYEDWAADLRRYPSLWLPHFGRVFDNYLDKTLGYSPQRVVNFLNREYDHLTGFRRDPGSSFAALRDLLPTRSARINRAGVIELGHSRFVHPLLAYWPDTPVTIRCSPDDETLIWVYIGDDILCEARPAA